MNDMTDTPTANATVGDEDNRLKRDLRTLLDSAEALLRHAKEDAGEGYAQARRSLEQNVERAKGQLATLEGEARERARRAGAAADDYVQEHPWRVVGLGAATGFLLGLLFSRR